MVFIIVATILALDQLSKIVVAKNLFLHQSVPVINGVFHLTLVHNQGAAFGILKNQLLLLIVTSLAAIALVCYNLRSGNGKRKIYIYALGFILAGAVGNLIDRIFFGYVIDFLDFRIWPVFNIADSSITIGACILGWVLLTSKEKRKENPKHQIPNSN